MSSKERTFVVWDFENPRDFPDGRHRGPVPIDLDSRDLWKIDVTLCKLKFQRFMGKCEGYALFRASKPTEHLLRNCDFFFHGMTTGRLDPTINKSVVPRSPGDNELKETVDKAGVVFEFALRNKRSFSKTTFDIFEEIMGRLRSKVHIQDLPYPDIYRRTEYHVGDDWGSGPIFWPLGHMLFNERYAHLG